jgi:hypothetical protein
MSKAKKKEICKDRLNEARQMVDKDIEETNNLIASNRQLLSKKASYVSDTSQTSSSSYS